MIQNICVIGAGTMGSGIAFTAALSGFETSIFDLNTSMLEKAQSTIRSNFDFLVAKQKLSQDKANELYETILFLSEEKDCKADLIIEAIVEKMEIKQQLFQKLSLINHSNSIFASNTSSLSISEIQKVVPNPQRVAGLHFFNPAHIMKLVEVVAGRETSTETIEALKEVCAKMQKTAVVCRDAPGFIVNRVARPYYLEAMNLVKHKRISLEDADLLMEATGFKMGPFRLMDLIGLDVNLAVSTSVYHAFDDELRFKPEEMQITKVAEGNLGKKSGKGFYDYTQSPK